MMLRFAAAGVALLAVPAAAAERVVSLGAAATEIVFALDRQEVLAGVDQTSTYPLEADALPDVGYFRQVGAEGILSLSPDLVLAVDGAGPSQALGAVARAGVVVVPVHGAYTPEGVAQRIAAVAEALEAPEAGDLLARTVMTDFAALADRLAGAAHRPTVVFAISIGDQSLSAAGGGTAADALIALAGGRNAIRTYDGYRTIGAEALMALRPDFLLLPSHAIESLGGVGKLAEITGLRLAGLADPDRVIVIETGFGLTFGPRQATAAAALAHHLHPDRVPLPEAAEGLIGSGSAWGPQEP